MAGDWIKIEHALSDKPEVAKIADILDIDPDAVVGKLIRFWSWCDIQSVDGNALGVTKLFLDRLTHQPGFTDALLKVDWLLARSGSLEVPHFARHNGQTAKARAVTNRRVAKHRETCNAPSVTNSLQKPLPEKRREELKELPPTPKGALEGESEKFQDSGDSNFPVARRQIRGEPLPERAQELAQIEAKINGLRTEWGSPARWSYTEKSNLATGGVADQIAELGDVDWAILQRFMKARLPEKSQYWQPRSRSKFVETFADTWGSAQRWATANQASSSGRFSKRPAQPVPANDESWDDARDEWAKINEKVESQTDGRAI